MKTKLLLALLFAIFQTIGFSQNQAVKNGATYITPKSNLNTVSKKHETKPKVIQLSDVDYLMGRVKPLSNDYNQDKAVVAIILEKYKINSDIKAIKDSEILEIVNQVKQSK